MHRTVTILDNQRPTKVAVYTEFGARKICRPKGDGRIYVRPARLGKPVGWEHMPGRSYAWFARVKQDGCIQYGQGDTIEEAVTSLQANIVLNGQTLERLCQGTPCLWLAPKPSLWQRLTDWWYAKQNNSI